MYYAPKQSLGSLGFSVKVGGAITHRVQLPDELKMTLKRTLPDLQEDFSRIGQSAENVVNFLPYVLVGGAALVSIIIILRAKSKKKAQSNAR